MSLWIVIRGLVSGSREDQVSHYRIPSRREEMTNPISAWEERERLDSGSKADQLVCCSVLQWVAVCCSVLQRERLDSGSKADQSLSATSTFWVRIDCRWDGGLVSGTTADQKQRLQMKFEQSRYWKKRRRPSCARVSLWNLSLSLFLSDSLALTSLSNRLFWD